METEEIDFSLLQNLLVPRKQIERNEVSRLLAFDDSDDEDQATLDNLMPLLDGMGVRKYISLKTLSRQRLQAYLTRKEEERELKPLALEALDRLHIILKTDIPEGFLPGGDLTNFVDELESLTLSKCPSGVKLSDPESSVGKGLVVDFSLTKAPLTVSAHTTGTALMNFCVRAEITDLSRLLTEGSYTMTEIGHPSSMVAKSADAIAQTVLPENYGKKKKLVVANPQSKPELAAGIRLVGHPTKSDEWESFPSEAIEELVQTSLGHIQSSYFREEEGAQSWRFYENAPWGLAFLSSACSAVCVFSIEMVGVLLFSIYGGGCSVGTDMYNDYIAVLDAVVEQRPVVDLRHTALTECQTVGKKVRWTPEPVDHYFYKIVRYDLFHKDRCPEHGIARGDNWRRLFDVYKRYSAVCEREDMPNALVPAALLYGEFQVAVRMVFIRGSTVEDDEEMTDQDFEDLAAALVFLAKQGLVYTDFRPQNVIRSLQDKRIRLIDYDDMKVVSLSVLKDEYNMILTKDFGPGFGAWVRKTISAAMGAIAELRDDR